MKKLITVRHYVNLIGWRSVLQIMREGCVRENERHIFYCDTWSLKLVAKMYGTTVVHCPGPSQIEVIRSLKNIQYLTANQQGGGSLTLPFFSNEKEMLDFLVHFQPTAKNIVIGISSPKQNYLALNLCKNNYLYQASIENIWCLGAALYGGHVRRKSFYLIDFLLIDPRRTLSKIKQTCQELLRLLLGRQAVDFAEFLSNLER